MLPAVEFVIKTQPVKGSAKLPKPICVLCQRFFRPFRNGAQMLENKPLDNGALPGIEAPTQWTPYKLWMAEPGSVAVGATIAVGFGKTPIWEKHRGPLSERIDLCVNDC